MLHEEMRALFEMGLAKIEYDKLLFLQPDGSWLEIDDDPPAPPVDYLINGWSTPNSTHGGVTCKVLDEINAEIARKGDELADYWIPDAVVGFHLPQEIQLVWANDPAVHYAIKRGIAHSSFNIRYLNGVTDGWSWLMAATGAPRTLSLVTGHKNVQAYGSPFPMNSPDDGFADYIEYRYSRAHFKPIDGSSFHDGART